MLFITHTSALIHIIVFCLFLYSVLQLYSPHLHRVKTTVGISNKNRQTRTLQRKRITHCWSVFDKYWYSRWES